MADKELDSHSKVCKICGQSKLRTRSGVFTKKVGKSPRWLGESGLLWNGLCCPECHRKQTAARMAIKRMLND